MRRLISPALLRFAAVGVVNTALDLGVFLLLRSLSIAIFPANLASTTVGLVFSFLVNRKFTFAAAGGGRKAFVRQAAVFLAVTGFGLWIIQPLVIFGATALIGQALPTGLIDAVPKLLGICVALVWNYVLYSLVVFRKPEERS